MGWACILLAVVVVVVAGHLLPDVYVAMGTKVMHNIKLFGEGLTNIPMDVVHSGGPCMVQPCFKPVGASAKLAHMGTDKQVFQISGTLVAFVLVAQCCEVGHGDECPHRVCFILTK